MLVINAARGGIVDEEALLEALDSGQVGGAGLDVFVEEPPPADHPLVNHPRVICTPHLGASTEQAQINVSVAVAEQVRDYLLDGVVRNSINVPSVSPELMSEVGPYLELAEKLGRFQGQLSARCDRAGRGRVRGRHRRAERRADHDRGAEGPASSAARRTSTW